MKKRFVAALMLLVFSSAIAVAQSGAMEILKRGNSLYARGEYEAAIKEYERVPQGQRLLYAQSLYNMGVCYFELGRTTQAVELYRRAAAARAGNYPKALYALGVALEVAGRLAEASDAYSRAITVSNGKYTEEGLAVAHYRLAMLMGRSGDYERAANLFREAIASSKGSFPAGHNNLGVMLALAGRVQEAEREFEIALREADDSFEDAAYNLSLCRSLLRRETQVAKLKVADSTFVLAR